MSVIVDSSIYLKDRVYGMSTAAHSEAGPSSAPQTETAREKKPVVIMCIGMAGSVSNLEP